MTIPEIRRWLDNIANSLAIKGNCTEETKAIRECIKELWRRPAVKQARAKARRMTPELEAKILAFYKEHPDMLNRDIGRVFNVDSGRVSEVLAGFRR